VAKGTFAKSIKKHVDVEIEQASMHLESGDLETAVRHLERAHILGQASTAQHTRVHWLMLKLGWIRRDLREVAGQILRIVGASTKTPFGIYPSGNTGGANVSPFKSMPIPADLEAILKRARGEK
jgi:hypothetical protein